MANGSARQVPPPLQWGTFGLATVVTAIALSGVGTFLALRQARSTTERVMAQAKLRAEQIAARASDRAQEQIDRVLRQVAEQYIAGPGGRGASLPAWVTGVLLFRDAVPQILLPPREPEIVDILSNRLVARPASSFGVRMPARTEVGFERLGNETIVTAWADYFDAESRSVAVAITIDARLLASDLLDAVVAADKTLELAPSGKSGGAWDQPLAGALRMWSIRPADRFVAEQNSTVLIQTLTYVALTSLALAALLLAMWMLTRAVRREISLAELKSNFVADVSHELKTPLALIRLYAETLQSGRVPSDEKRREYYDIIARESTRLTNLINNILDFARIEAGRKEYELVPIDAAETIRQTYEAYRPQLEQAGFEHQLSIAPALPQIDADRDAVSQILVNLMSNAIKYSAEEKYLLVEVGPDMRRDRRGILISVHDRGIGIRPEDRAFLTEGFYRAKDAHVRQQGGTGLGLALVKHIVEVHGGSLDIETRLVKGSTFRVFLPAAESVRAGTAFARRADHAAESQRTTGSPIADPGEMSSC